MKVVFQTSSCGIIREVKFSNEVRNMSLTIKLPAELEARVQEAATQHGQDAAEYVIDVVERALRKPSLDDVLAPVREQFAAGGMTEEELTALVKEERRAMWREKHGAKSP